MSNLPLASFQKGWSEFDNRPIYDWAKDNVNLHSAYSIPGKFDVNRSRFLIEPFDALKDLRVRQVNIMASPRCAKTLLGELFMLHTIANNAGTFLWLQSSDEMIDKMSDLRMMPLLRSCKPVAQMIDKTDRFAVTKRKFSFPHMQMNLSSAKIRSLQSIGYRFIVGDETWLWDAGMIGEMQSRVIDFINTYKIVLLSQGSFEGDDWSREFNEGLVYEWGFRCAACNTEQVLQFNHKREDGSYAGVIWDKSATTCPGGMWNFREAAKTARLECINPACKHQYADNPQNRRYLNDHGLYLLTGPNGDPKKKSYRWNALANIEIPFGDLCVEYLQAKDTLTREGNKIPITEFHQKRLAKSFNQNLQVALSTIITAEYNPNEKYGDYQFMTIDCQNSLSDFYYVIRWWSNDGTSRLMKYGRAPTFADLRRIQLENNIRDQCVLIDSGYFATQIYAKCIEYSHIGIVNKRRVNLSWITLKGWDAYDFAHTDNTKKLYSTETRGDPNLGKSAQGKTCPLYRWSNYSVKNMLMHLRDGKGVSWLANEVEEEYTKQMNSEMLTKEIDKKTNKERWIWVNRHGASNHYWDCECMQVVAACMVGIMGNMNNKTTP